MTKEESEKVQQIAQRIVSDFGIDHLNAMTVEIHNGYINAMRNHLEVETGVTYETARQHIAKACRRLRHPSAETESGWGGNRNGAGRKEKSNNA